MPFWLVLFGAAGGAYLLGKMAEAEEEMARKARRRARNLRRRRARRLRRAIEGEQARIAERIGVLQGLLQATDDPWERASLEAALWNQEEALRNARW